MSICDQQRLFEIFFGMILSKDLALKIKNKHPSLPLYVIEDLLTSFAKDGCEAKIREGESVILALLNDHFQDGKITLENLSSLAENKKTLVFDKVRAEYNPEAQSYEAFFSRLGSLKFFLEEDIDFFPPDIFSSGAWCLAEIGVYKGEKKNFFSHEVNYLTVFKDPDNAYLSYYIKARESFSTNEWMDIIIHAMGIDPRGLEERVKLLFISRLIPLCEKNFYLMEIGRVGNGKTHAYSEFSSEAVLLKASDATVSNLFVNKSSGRLGLMGHSCCVAFDDFTGKRESGDKDLSEALSDYMKRGYFPKGDQNVFNHASLVFAGDLKEIRGIITTSPGVFSEIPEAFRTAEFLERMHFFLPGWELPDVSSLSFSIGPGLSLSYLSWMFRALRDKDYSRAYEKTHSFHVMDPDDKRAVQRTFSGLVKLIHPGGSLSESETEKLLTLAIEGRKRVKDQLSLLYPVRPKVAYCFFSLNNVRFIVTTPEEPRFPAALDLELMNGPDGSPGDIGPKTWAEGFGIGEEDAGGPSSSESIIFPHKFDPFDSINIEYFSDDKLWEEENERIPDSVFQLPPESKGFSEELHSLSLARDQANSHEAEETTEDENYDATRDCLEEIFLMYRDETDAIRNPDKADEPCDYDEIKTIFEFCRMHEVNKRCEIYRTEDFYKIPVIDMLVIIFDVYGDDMVGNNDKVDMIKRLNEIYKLFDTYKIDDIYVIPMFDMADTIIKIDDIHKNDTGGNIYKEDLIE